MADAEPSASAAENTNSIDTPLPPSPPSPPVPPVPQKTPPLSTVLAAAPSRADAFLAHLARCMQTRAGAETVLLFVCYATRLAGSVLEAVGGAALRQSARRLVALAYSLPPATTVVMASAAPQPSLAALALRLGGRFKALSAVVSETRTMGRLWGLLGLYFAAKRLVLRSRAAGPRRGKEEEEKHDGGDDDDDDDDDAAFDTLVAWAQTLSLIVYQAAENAAYLAAKKVLPLSPATQGRLGLASVRAWGLYVAIEGARLLVERSRRRSGGAAPAKDADWAARWNKSFYRNLAWAPLTVHWGTRQGFLPDIAVSLLAFYPSVGAMADLWREQTA
ncbi:uncharacterized protein UV8b_05271 [Ustilaginoidea virens]|uniref:Peroxin 11C n=1 Tax=Ustilaginoidea virens TaxID=1159556 RepID=A0A1B5KUN4_USTVR|nr:uncharacterized protein UV8b_05271 [Ustilaginoidea virens]QUC21030.1 hypothetical protein UV8b_05271 [Ustilaginoidea virens]GAO14661.1 hypothetical protein UVI_02008910 [Ustilaginoidea virens]